LYSLSCMSALNKSRCKISHFCAWFLSYLEEEHKQNEMFNTKTVKHVHWFLHLSV
jgi:hypothetical protein